MTQANPEQPVEQTPPADPEPALPPAQPKPAPNDTEVTPAVDVLPDASSEMLELLVGNARIRRLWTRAETLSSQVNQSVSQPARAEELIAKIERARSLILAGRDRFEETDRLLSEVEFRLTATRRAHEAGRAMGPWLLGYEVLWLALLAVAFYFVNLTPMVTSVYLAPPLDRVSVIQFLNSLIWGSMGGLVGALYALWKHIGDQQDFDRQYTIWYVTNPILGLALGAFVFLIIQAGFLSLTAGSEDDAIRSASVIYVLAWVAGFKQNVVYEMVRRVLDVFRVNTEDKPAESGEPDLPKG
jgi:hypothetical protein